MENILWIQNKDSGKESTYFYKGKRINGNEKESFKLTRFLTETKFRTIYQSKNGTLKEISRDSDGYLIAGLLLNEEDNGRRIPYTGYIKGQAGEIIDYLNSTLNSNSMFISDEDLELIKKHINRNKNKKAIVVSGIAVISLIAIYVYAYGKS
jgi:hypothetical protein